MVLYYKWESRALLYKFFYTKNGKAELCGGNGVLLQVEEQSSIALVVLRDR
jgi:hypothetical protein